MKEYTVIFHLCTGAEVPCNLIGSAVAYLGDHIEHATTMTITICQGQTLHVYALDAKPFCKKEVDLKWELRDV